MLASASPARSWLLSSAGLRFSVRASGIDEGEADGLGPAEAALELAGRKARTVAETLADDDALVLGCDSLLEFDGSTWGKPECAEEVARRWKRMRGKTGLLHTGHVLMQAPSGPTVSEVDTALIRFGSPNDSEIAAYASTPEALQVAGPFTLEGRSAPWIESIDGNYGTVTGVSLAALRRLLAALDVDIVDLWDSES